MMKLEIILSARGKDFFGIEVIRISNVDDLTGRNWLDT